MAWRVKTGCRIYSKQQATRSKQGKQKKKIPTTNATFWLFSRHNMLPLASQQRSLSSSTERSTVCTQKCMRSKEFSAWVIKSETQPHAGSRDSSFLACQSRYALWPPRKRKCFCIHSGPATCLAACILPPPPLIYIIWLGFKLGK